jgi:hypothetical protein
MAGWKNSPYYIPYLAKYIGQEGGVIEEVGTFGLECRLEYRVRTAIDGDFPSLFMFPEEALELLVNKGK